MDARTFVVNAGLAKPGRGRFSSEAKAAIAAAERSGIVFDKVDKLAPKAGKPAPKADKPKASLPAVVKPVEKKIQRTDFDPAKVRAWAIAKGREIAAKGRIPGELVAEYLADNPDAPKRSDAPAEFAIAAAPTHDLDGTWVGKDSKGKVWRFSSRSVCGTCSYSLDHHICDKPTASTGYGYIAVKEK